MLRVDGIATLGSLRLGWSASTRAQRQGNAALERSDEGRTIHSGARVQAQGSAASQLGIRGSWQLGPGRGRTQHHWAALRPHRRQGTRPAAAPASAAVAGPSRPRCCACRAARRWPSQCLRQQARGLSSVHQSRQQRAKAGSRCRRQMARQHRYKLRFTEDPGARNCALSALRTWHAGELARRGVTPQAGKARGWARVVRAPAGRQRCCCWEASVERQLAFIWELAVRQRLCPRHCRIWDLWRAGEVRQVRSSRREHTPACKAMRMGGKVLHSGTSRQPRRPAREETAAASCGACPAPVPAISPRVQRKPRTLATPPAPGLPMPPVPAPATSCCREGGGRGKVTGRSRGRHAPGTTTSKL